VSRMASWSYEVRVREFEYSDTSSLDAFASPTAADAKAIVDITVQVDGNTISDVEALKARVFDTLQEEMKNQRLTQQKISGGLLYLSDHVVVFEDDDTLNSIHDSAEAAEAIVDKTISLDLRIISGNDPQPTAFDVNHQVQGWEPSAPRLLAIAKKKQNASWKSGWSDKLVLLSGSFIRYYRPSGNIKKTLSKAPQTCINLKFTRLFQRGRRLEFQASGRSFMFEFERAEFDHVNVWARNIQATTARLKARTESGLKSNLWPIVIPGSCVKCQKVFGVFRSSTSCKGCSVRLCSKCTQAKGKCEHCVRYDLKAGLGLVDMTDQSAAIDKCKMETEVLGSLPILACIGVRYSNF